MPLISIRCNHFLVYFKTRYLILTYLSWSCHLLVIYANTGKPDVWLGDKLRFENDVDTNISTLLKKLKVKNKMIKILVNSFLINRFETIIHVYE